ncbi:hypothetical protein HN592_00765 [Candidatus Woesearchaeota archaeon]|jgi:hypothetical protein|nr:hypothetical protein [Candidatus Woesearchaeota archaeon]MBT4368835.1 hypothetical protein [Candidatus Woesearchaeota archaeon]MBT4712124.1 hypothetical protein [Candidatus Woesearchaeota archaeon]MBT6639128.1 hypothetical protein [Candidatus Woesearchaeota archaeon]MBT7134328.1 hypothetical protein [Candidatus Woesearchaeota archaeon]
MKMKYEWVLVVVLIIITLFVVLSINPKSDCHKECVVKGYDTGRCLDMPKELTCESKFNYSSLSTEFCSQKNYQGFYYACCCQ